MTLSWLPAHLLLLALWSPEAPPMAAEPVPETPASAPAVEARGPAVEVVRVKRDFGKPHFDLVIDAWSDAGRLDETRLWWVNTSESDRRKPLGRVIERMVHLHYQRLSETALTVVVAGDGKEFTFTVELAADGKIHAFVPIDTDGGQHITRCRTDSARLLARRVLGMPVGIDRIAVTCRHGGALHRGQIRHREV